MKNTKKIMALLLTMLMVTAVLSANGAVASADDGYVYPTMTIQLAHPDPPSEDSSFHQLALSFAEHVSELSDGAITIEILHSSQMGSGTDVINSMQMGAFDMQIEVTNSFPNYNFNKFMMFDLPFAFRDAAQAQAWAQTDTFKECMAAGADEFGVRILTTANGFMRETYTTDRELKELADYSGMKIRTPDVVTITGLYNALGANATPMAYGECFTALQQGTIDAIELPVSSFISGNFFEACKYATIDNHVFNCLTIQVSEARWQTWDKEVQDLLYEAAELASEDECAWAAETEQALLDALEEKGVAVVTDIDTAELREACSGVWEEYRDSIGPELYDEFIEWINNN